MGAQGPRPAVASRVLGLDHVAVKVPDVDALTAFYTERWGLELVEKRGDERFLASRAVRFADLVLMPGSRLALDHIAFEAPTETVIAELAERVVAAGYPCVRPPESAAEPGQDTSAAVRDPDGNLVELVVGPARPVSGASEQERVAPNKLGHVVLATAHRDEMESFYKLLGFCVSDRTAQGMSFLRCNADHHTLALVQSEAAWRQHLAFDVGTVDHVMRGMAELSDHRIAPIWGPGRHGPGNNVFTYYQDPAGLIIEYYGELQQFQNFDPDLVAWEWGPEHRGDVWDSWDGPRRRSSSPLRRASDAVSGLQLSYAGHLSDRVQDLYFGTVGVEGVELHFLPMSPAEAFRRVIAGEFHAGEMSLATYIVKVARGEGDLVAIPVFPSRTFRHSAIYVGEHSGIDEPSDLVGRTVGVPEYHMTAALWVRGMLAHEYGVHPADLRWVTGGLQDTRRRALIKVDVPGVAISHIADRSLDELLRAGEIDAIVAPQDPPSFVMGAGVRRMFPNYREVEVAYYRKTGLFPIMHTVVLRRSFFEAHPWSAVSLYRAFDEARARAMSRLLSREPLPVSLPWLQPEIDSTLATMGPNFWPYGVAENRAVIEAACTYSVEQGVCDRLVDVEELFAPNVLGLSSIAAL